MNGNDEVGGGSPVPSHLGDGGGQVVDLGLTALSGAVEIGRGAAGVVYRAEQPSVNRTVAVKMLPYAAMDDAARTRFERETRAMGALSSHPSIVTVFDAGFTPSGQPYIIMELMDGGSLGERLLHQGRLGWEEVVEYGIKVAGALDAAHRKGVLHRDIKPDNILISAYGEPKLADFSIARVLGAEQTQSGLVSATPAHAAPEILRGDPPTEQADVYSLGSTLLTLLHGSPAFVRDSDTSLLPVLARVERDPVPDLRPLGVPDEVCRVLERSMAKDPAHRQRSAAEQAAELRSARDAVRGVGPARIGPPPPAQPGATMAGLSPVPAPWGGDAAGGFPAGASRGGRAAGPGRAVLIAAGAVAALAVAAIATALLIRGGSGSTTLSTSALGAQSGTPAANRATATPSLPVGALDSRVISATDVGAGFGAYGTVARLSDQTPCNQPVPVPALAETDRAFQATSGDGTPIVVNVSLAQFPSGGADSYLRSLALAMGSCGRYRTQQNGLDTTDTIQARGSGAILGDGSVVRYEVTLQEPSNVVVGEEVTACRRGDVVVLVDERRLGAGNPSDTERIAGLQVSRL